MITQQIARTLFLKKYTGSVRRKIVEIFLAIWFDRCFSKQDIINIYVCSVRYERNVNGIIEDIKYFFPNINISNLNKSQATFLIERVSNVNSRLIIDKFSANIKYLYTIGLLDRSEIIELLDIFEFQFMAGRLKTNEDDLKSLRGDLLYEIFFSAV